MAGRKQRGRGGGRGYRGGRGSSRGGGRGGRGGGGGGSRGRGRGLGYAMRDEIDDDFVVVPLYPRDYSRRGAPSPNTSGYKHPGRRGYDHEPDYSDGLDSNDYYYNSRQSTPVQGASPRRGSSRGNGYQRGRGQWGIAGPDLDLFEPRNVLRKRHLESKLRGGKASLSQLLYEDRPFLKPITFVPSKLTPTLFLRDEEIFKPVAEEAGDQEASHVPTAERVYQIIHGGHSGPQPSESLSDEEELPEVDFADLGSFMSKFEPTTVSSQKTIITTPTSPTAVSCISMSVVQKVENEPVIPTTEEEPTGFYIDTKPSPVRDSIAVEHPGTGILGEDDDDDEIIVYVAPHPRISTLASPDATTLPPTAATNHVAAPVHQNTYDAPHAPALPPKPEPKLWPEPVPLQLFPKDIVVPALSPAPAPAPSFKDFSFFHLSSPSKPTHRVRWPRHTARRKAKFSLRGAMRAEASLRELDPRQAEQRRGDSDVDWGGSTSGIADVEDNGEDGGMLVDPDIGTSAMVSFARSMDVTGQAHVSAGDLEDEERIRLEDADEEEEDNESTNGGDEEVDTELELADGLKGILARDEDEEASRSSSVYDDGDDTSEDEEETPKRSFQTRLERMRSRSVGRPIKDMVREELDQDGELDDDLNSDSDSDDDIISQIESFFDENDHILRANGRKQRNVVFRAIQNGMFEVEVDRSIDASPKRKRDKHKHIPLELQDQWERDRVKKAERKRLRELERLAAASADFFTPTKRKKKGKKARKARRAAEAAAAAVSLETIAEHMRAFVTDLGGAPMLALPPMEKRMRKLVHDLANAFNLNSKSEGNGKARFTTLTKTTMSGVRVDERKIARILGKPKPDGGGGGGGKGKGKAVGKIRPRDGEVVGGAAPKIDGSNRGFRMLADMGWQEGTRIGAIGGHGGGLDVPLLAVVKTTKSGLGASSRRG